MSIDLQSQQEVTAFIEQEQLIALMSDETWQRLIEAMSSLPEELGFSITYVDGTSKPINDLQHIQGNYIALGFIDVETIVVDSHGNATDHKEAVIDLCLSHNAKITLKESRVRIWGYYRPGRQPDFYSKN